MKDTTPPHATGDFSSGLFRPTASTRILALAGIFLPILTLFAVCFHYLSPLPVTDDYDAVLRMLVHAKAQPTLGSRIIATLLWQHNEYRAMYGNAIVGLQNALAGRTNFVALSLIGDMQLLLLGWLLWRHFAPRSIAPMQRAALFVPVSLLTFQLNYGETLNWSMPCLQNVGVVVFALLTIVALSRAERSMFAGACASLALTIAASGNGFLVVPVGLLYLWRTGQRRRLAVWCGAAVAYATVYFHHYVRAAPPLPQPGAVHHSGPLSIVLFIVSFLGAAGAVKFTLVRYFSLPLGALLCVAVWSGIRQRFDRANPVIAYFALFLLLTSLGVAVIRSSGGYDQSLSGRYKIYSSLLLVSAYCLGLHQWANRDHSQRRNIYRVCMCVASLIFVAGMANGTRLMRERYIQLTQGMELYKASGGTKGPIQPQTQVAAGPTITLNEGLAAHFRGILHDAEARGIYKLP